LSPFSGTTRIIHQQAIRAISNDGVNWRLQIRSNSSNEEANRYVLFGLWTRSNGLTEFPVHPTQVDPQHRTLAIDFVESLPGYLDTASFPLRDTLECWLLDQQQQPLALLRACQPGEPRPHLHNPRWIPCAPDDHTFVSPHVRLPDRAHDQSTPVVYHRDLVAQIVHQAADQPSQYQWFQRQPDGSGLGEDDTTMKTEIHADHLPTEAFPHFLLRQTWPDQQSQQLMNDFFQWQSPWLLTLPDLTSTERQQLERQACGYPRRLAALYHLYPDIIDKTRLNKTLIQAQLQKAAPENDDLT
jgi:hypothetical protein